MSELLVEKFQNWLYMLRLYVMWIDLFLIADLFQNISDYTSFYIKILQFSLDEICAIFLILSNPSPLCPDFLKTALSNCEIR